MKNKKIIVVGSVWILVIALFAGAGAGNAFGADKVSLISSSESADQIAVHGSSTLTVVVGGADQNQTVLVDLELITNATGARVNQKWFDNQNIVANGTNTYAMTTGDLPEGTYHYAVGIFGPGWNGVQNWYNSVQSFSVGSGGGAGGTSGNVSVALQSAALFSNHTNNCPNLVATLGDNSSNSARILLDMEVQKNGKKISQDVVDNFSIAAGQTVQTSPLHCFPPDGAHDLPAGTYTYNLGLFNPNWEGELKWYGAVETIVISNGTDNNNERVVLENEETRVGASAQGAPTLHVGFMNEDSANAHNVLIDFELYDANSHRVYEQAFDNQSLAAAATLTKDITGPLGLPAGDYRWAVGLFNPGWNGVVRWYNSVATFTQSGPDMEQIFVVRIDRPKMNLANGSSASITPTLINTGATLADVTVKVSLWRGGNFIDQVVYAHQALSQNVEASFPFHTIPLMQGSYTIQTAVFDASGKTLQAFPDLGTIGVNP